MRRLTDIRIEVGERPGTAAPRAAKPASNPPARPPRGGARAGARLAPRQRWVSPYWWKKHKRAALALAAGTGVALFAVWLDHSAGGHHFADLLRGQSLTLSARAGFRVEDILVDGRNRAPRDELLAALAIRRGDPIFGVDLSATRQRLEEISWVKTATIERRLPNEVHLIITERAPIVLWQNQGRYYLVDADGQVVGDEIEEYADLPLMVGEGAPDHAVELVDLLKAEPELAKRTKATQWVGGRRWNITLSGTGGPVEIRLPEDAPVAAWHELARLDREQKLLDRQVTVVDMRLPDRLVLRGPGHPQEPVKAGQPKHKTQTGKDA